MEPIIGTAPRQTRRRRQEKKFGFNKVFRFIMIFFMITAGAGTAWVTVVVGGILLNTPPIDGKNIYGLLDESSYILDAKGNLLEKIEAEGFREIVPYRRIPKKVKDAFVAIEDERFWYHQGIDVQRLAGVIVKNFKTGSKQGASTISQQLAKNLYLTNEQTYTRKIKDMYYALQLEWQLPKTQILEGYLNTIYLGSGAYGVQAASQKYFSKDIEDLTIAEAALIAGVTKNPSKYSPMKTIEKSQVQVGDYVIDDSDPIYTIVFDEHCIERQRLVLQAMLKNRYITELQYQEALKEDIMRKLKHGGRANMEISSYFGDLVKRDVIKSLTEAGHSEDEAVRLLQYGGLRIYSTINTTMQKILEEEYQNPENFPGTNLDETGNPQPLIGGNPQPQSAMVIIDYRTGEIKSLIGGRMTSGRKIFNRALAPRQPGSAIKPIAVFTPAIDKGYTAATIVQDTPSYYNGGAPGVPWPRNWYKNGYFGPMTIRQALQWSSNVVAVKVADSLGKDGVRSYDVMFDYMEKMGISTVVRGKNSLIINGKKYNDENLSTALGGMTKGVSPLEMTAAYGTLANGGTYIKPITFTKILNREGHILVENKPKKNRVVSPEAAYIMTDMLRTIVSEGTATRAKLDPENMRMPAAGKTGTTSDKKDAWFVGYTPYYAAGVWIGNDKPEPLADGSKMAAVLWQRVMARIHGMVPSKDFEKPKAVITVKLGSRTELFVKGTEPKGGKVVDESKLDAAPALAGSEDAETSAETSAKTPSANVETSELAEQGEKFVYYTVRKGDTIFSICRKFYKDETKRHRVLEYNHITNPGDIKAGQVIKIPDV